MPRRGLSLPPIVKGLEECYLHLHLRLPTKTNWPLRTEKGWLLNGEELAFTWRRAGLYLEKGWPLSGEGLASTKGEGLASTNGEGLASTWRRTGFSMEKGWPLSGDWTLS
jgi:hypothetical protein